MIIVTPGNCKRICKVLKKRKNKAARPAATGRTTLLKGLSVMKRIIAYSISRKEGVVK